MNDESDIVEPKLLAIVGSRRLRDSARFNAVVDDWILTNGMPDGIVTGCASGADELARKYAADRQIECAVKKAHWKSQGRAAGPIRNTQIVAACTHLLALPDEASKGTHDSIAKARSAGKHVTVINM